METLAPTTALRKHTHTHTAHISHCVFGCVRANVVMFYSKIYMATLLMPLNVADSHLWFSEPNSYKPLWRYKFLPCRGIQVKPKNREHKYTYFSVEQCNFRHLCSRTPCHVQPLHIIRTTTTFLYRNTPPLRVQSQYAPWLLAEQWEYVYCMISMWCVCAWRVTIQNRQNGKRNSSSSSSLNE